MKPLVAVLMNIHTSKFLNDTEVIIEMETRSILMKFYLMFMEYYQRDCAKVFTPPAHFQGVGSSCNHVPGDFELEEALQMNNADLAFVCIVSARWLENHAEYCFHLF